MKTAIIVVDSDLAGNMSDKLEIIASCENVRCMCAGMHARMIGRSHPTKKERRRN